MMRLIKKIFSYTGITLYVFILFLLMTFYRLPADKLIAATMESLTNGRLLFKAEKVSPVLPTGYRLEEVSYGIFIRDTPAKDHFKSLTFGPDYREIFMGHLPIKFNGVMPRGNIHGKTGLSIPSRGKEGYLTIKASDVYLEDLNILRSFSDRNFKGKIGGEIKIEGDLADLSKIYGEGHLYLKEGSIDTRISIPGMEAIPFKGIKLAFTIKDGKVVLENSKMDGPMFSGNFSGEIRLNKSIADSEIEITARMRPGPLLENDQLTGKFLAKVMKENDPLVIRIGGNLNRPNIKWGKS